MDKYYYYIKNGIESPYAVNYKEAALNWFKENDYKLIEYDNSGSKTPIHE